MDPSSAQNLDDFLTNQKRCGRFLLVPAFMQGGRLEIDSSRAISLTKITITEAWQIDIDNPVSCAIQEDDDVIIPQDHLMDAPVLKVIEKFKR